MTTFNRGKWIQFELSSAFGVRPTAVHMHIREEIGYTLTEERKK